MLSRFSDPTRETLGVVERFGFGMIDGLMKLFSIIIFINQNWNYKKTYEEVIAPKAAVQDSV